MPDLPKLPLPAANSILSTSDIAGDYQENINHRTQKTPTMITSVSSTEKTMRELLPAV